MDRALREGLQAPQCHADAAARAAPPTRRHPGSLLSHDHSLPPNSKRHLDLASTMAALASALASVPLRASRGLLPQPAQVLARPAAALPPRRSRAACSAAARPEDEVSSAAAAAGRVPSPARRGRPHLQVQAPGLIPRPLPTHHRSWLQIEPVPPALLSALSSTDELTEEAAWLGSMVKCWANEEWAAAELFPVHEELGEATGQVRCCAALRCPAALRCAAPLRCPACVPTPACLLLACADPPPPPPPFVSHPACAPRAGLPAGAAAGGDE